MEILKYENKEMELCCIISTNTVDTRRRGDLWDGEIYSRHGNGFSKFWFQRQGSKLPIK